VAVFGGSEVTSDMSKILVRQPRFPTAWQWGDGHIIGAAVRRPIAAIGQVARLEPELARGPTLSIDACNRGLGGALSALAAIPLERLHPDDSRRFHRH